MTAQGGPRAETEPAQVGGAHWAEAADQDEVHEAGEVTMTQAEVSSAVW